MFGESDSCESAAAEHEISPNHSFSTLQTISHCGAGSCQRSLASQHHPAFVFSYSSCWHMFHVRQAKEGQQIRAWIADTGWEKWCMLLYFIFLLDFLLQLGVADKRRLLKIFVWCFLPDIYIGNYTLVATLCLIYESILDQVFDIFSFGSPYNSKQVSGPNLILGILKVSVKGVQTPLIHIMALYWCWGRSSNHLQLWSCLAHISM